MRTNNEPVLSLNINLCVHRDNEVVTRFSNNFGNLEESVCFHVNFLTLDQQFQFFTPQKKVFFMTGYLALLGFIAFMVGTPGPANLVAMLAGVTQGLQGSAGFISGLIVGKIVLNLLIGLGFGVVFAVDPFLQKVLTYTSACYMVLLVVRSWPRSVNLAKDQLHKSSVKFRFRDGLFVHPLNPKAWVMVVLAWGSFAPALGDFSLRLPVVILSFAVCQLVFHSFWCALGAYLGKSFIYNQRISKLVIIFTVLVVLVTLFYAPLA